jgi:hypothetical protein
MSIIQCGVTRYRTAGRLGAGRMVKTVRTRKQELETHRSQGKTAARVDEQHKQATDK